MSVELDKDTAATMTDEELAAIKDDEFSPEELAAMKSVAGEDGDDEGDDEEGSESDGAGKAAAPVLGNTESESAPDPVTPVVEAAAKPAEFTPRLNAQLPEDYDAKVAELRAQSKELAEKFRSGELDFDAYQAEADKLAAERDALATQKTKADIAADFNAQTIEQKWNFAVQSFTDKVRESEHIDYRTDLAKQADLDAFVKALASKPENEDKPMEWFLSEAHKRVKALNGISPATSEAPNESKEQAAPSRKPPTPPVTLSQVPGGEGKGDVGGDEFTDLDGLEGLELEEAIAKMSPAQRERYLRGG